MCLIRCFVLYTYLILYNKIQNARIYHLQFIAGFELQMKFVILLKLKLKNLYGTQPWSLASVARALVPMWNRTPAVSPMCWPLLHHNNPCSFDTKQWYISWSYIVNLVGHTGFSLKHCDINIILTHRIVLR